MTLPLFLVVVLDDPILRSGLAPGCCSGFGAAAGVGGGGGAGGAGGSGGGLGGLGGAVLKHISLVPFVE